MSDSTLKKSNEISNKEQTQTDLQSTWIVSYVHKNLTKNDKKDIASWSTAIRNIASFNQLEQAKYVFSEIPKPSQWPINSNLGVFREGIRPVWEDPMNSDGGRICIKIECDIDDEGIISLPSYGSESKRSLVGNKIDNASKEEVHKALSEAIDKLFENLLLYVICESFPEFPDIVNVIVFSPRRMNPRINIWMRGDHCFANKRHEFEQKYTEFLNENKLLTFRVNDGVERSLRTVINYGKLDDPDTNTKGNRNRH